MFGDSRGQIVVGDFSGHATHRRESGHVTADEGFEALAVRGLQVQHPALCFHQGEGIELAFDAGVIECAEMAPIDLGALARRRLHPPEGARRLPRRAGGVHVLAQEGVGVGVAVRAESLFDDGGRGFKNCCGVKTAQNALVLSRHQRSPQTDRLRAAPS